MAEPKPDKPGLLSRLFGRKAPAGEVERGEAAHPEASRSEGRPDFTTAEAAGELPPVLPTVTQADPDVPPEEKLPAELTGADLQPVETIEPQGGAPAEPVPRPEPGSGPLPARDAPGIAAAAAPASQERAESPGGTPQGAAQAASADAAGPAGKGGWWGRLTTGLKRTSSSLNESVTGLFTKRRLDAATVEELEDALIQADLGVDVAARITGKLSQGRFNKEISPGEVRQVLASEIEAVLAPVAKPLVLDGAKKPFVILMIGVNGAGKTTTIGKLARKFKEGGRSVMLAAGDTFRAAAIDQLKVWGERSGVPVVTREQGADAAGLAFDAVREAAGQGVDVLLVDTAGRLQNKAGLMAELEKIVRVLKKQDETAPHATLLVLDATVGQNAISQVELFRQSAGVTGLVMTKLDGTARGGILVALAAKFGLPVHFIGVGEGVEDLEPFNARDFARAVTGLEQA